MKVLRISIIVSLSFLVGFPRLAIAQEVHVGNEKFILPVVEKWIAEYKKENPESPITIETGQNRNESTAGLCIIANKVPKTGKDKIVYLGKYALIPVSNSSSPLLIKMGKGLRKKDLTNLLFEKSIDDEDYFEGSQKEKIIATVYSRKGKVATTITLAEAFGASIDRIKGKGIIGDDIYLVEAVQKDENGIAYNTMNYVYDINSRRLKSGLKILPLNISSKYREVIESEDMDKTIKLLEETKIDEIPVGNFGLRILEGFEKNVEVQKFVNWLINSSSVFNHQFGFMNLNDEELAEQKRWLQV